MRACLVSCEAATDVRSQSEQSGAVQSGQWSLVVAAWSVTTSPLVCPASYVTDALTTVVQTITASISADSNYVAASNSASLTIGKQGTLIALGANPTSITPIQTSTLTAVVSAASSGSPTGTVTHFHSYPKSALPLRNKNPFSTQFVRKRASSPPRESLQRSSQKRGTGGGKDHNQFTK
jgi:hypothetical protein